VTLSAAAPADRHRPCALKDAPILLLDEATSALDTENDGRCSGRSIADEKRTCLVIAHRLSTIRHATRIACSPRGGS